jgi:hypothetical protein
MEDEYKSLLHNNTWILTNLPIGRKENGFVVGRPMQMVKS